VATTGGFTVYTITLPSADLIPSLQSLAGSNSPLTNPTSVLVYASSNTQTLTSSSLAAGAGARFRGVLLDDNGVIKMAGQEILAPAPAS